jgi:hypothetical protein
VTVSVQVRDGLGDAEWDESLARLGGHPLQSAHWGRAREQTDGRRFVGFAGYENGEPVWMVRADIRHVPLLGRVAWVPRGPTVSPCACGDVASTWMSRLSGLGFCMCICSPWRTVLDEGDASTGPRTIWIDLAKGREHLWNGLQKKWRHGVGYAARAGVQVAQTRDAQRVGEFFRLCQSVSQAKGFSLPASETLMRNLLDSSADGPVSSHLFLATFENRLSAGAFIIRCGRHVHYFWGATDRDVSRVRPGEALQWAVIEWALAQGCTLYDLEGIDPAGNAGTYEFKRKMGGVEIPLAAKKTIPLSWAGRLIAPIVGSLIE